GTGDISVHEKQIDGSLKEIHKPSGGSFGGTQVDDNFLQWLTKLFGKFTMETFKEEGMDAYFNLLRDFESKKRLMRPDVSRKITFNVGLYRLLEFYKRNEDMPIEEKIAALGLEHKLKLYPDKLSVDASIIRKWFESPVRMIISHVKDILAESNMKNVKTILLVGGFGESDIVYEAMKTNFENTHTIIRPHEASLAVLKGAVRFGHIPDIIRYRIMTATYGINVMNNFDKGKHPVSKKIIRNNREMVDNIFDIFVRKDDNIELGKEILEDDFTSTNLQKTYIAIYKSTKRDPEYVTDEGCTKLGALTIEHPEGKTFEDKKFDITFVFGDTELFVKVKIKKTGQEFDKYINCLEQ
ncbi:heat shock 70 kDa protein 12B-like, partial [Ruditapes philippinarum]|uniref:heat shock 70 kDa protein 12B-like n=1 Tax=Ruditapes philippinarum TaxID=129788 RepID=UPI00295AA8D3